MQKIREVLVMLYKAFLYSFRFCWRNSRTATVVRMIFSVVSPLIAYSVFLFTGMVLNAAQRSYGKIDIESPLKDVLQSGVLGPVVALVGILLFSSLLVQVHWYFKNYWYQSLHFANLDEINKQNSSLDVATFQSKEFDTLTRRIRELPQGERTRLMFADEAFNLFSTTMSFLFFGMSLVWFKPMYAVILFAVAIPMILESFKLTSKWWRLYEEVMPHHKRRSVLNTAFNDNTTFGQAKLFNQHSPLSKQIRTNADHIIDLYTMIRRTSVKSEILGKSFMLLGLTAVIVYAVYDTLVHSKPLGSLSIIIGSARTFQGNLEAIVSTLADQWNSAKGVILIQEEYFALRSKVVTIDPIVPTFAHPSIHIDRVTYSYPDQDKPALNAASCEIRRGMTYALVGSNGAGKSTLVEMILRRRDPDSGSVYFDDINAKNIEPDVLHEYVSALTQRHRILDRKVADEIASSRLDKPIDMKKVEAAVAHSRFDQVIEKCDEK
jgi:ABC-type bacteriocin/lantibiotic exporter with double-glycine peptidase domain